MLEQINNFLTNEECDVLISAMETAIPSFSTYNTANFNDIQAYLQAQRSPGIFIDPPYTTYSWGNNIGRGNRTQLFFDRSDSAVTSVITKLANYTGLPTSHQTRPLLFKYEVGGQYVTRADFFSCLSPSRTQQLSESQDTSYFEWKKSFIQQGGQRLKSMIIFLNDDFDGGSIQFAPTSTVIAPQKGKAIIFDVVQPGITDENGDLVMDTNMFYADNLVTSNSKYTLHIWIREGVPAV